MKTFLVVALYTLMVAALDLGGAVWTSLHAKTPAKMAVTAVAATVETPAKTGSAPCGHGTIPSDT